MISEGMSVARLNLSHGTIDEHKKYVSNAREAAGIKTIYVGNENRTPIATIKEFPPDPTKLFAAINVTTSGTTNYPETISKIKVFHFINETQGSVTEIDYSTQNFNELIQGHNNSNNPIQLVVV